MIQSSQRMEPITSFIVMDILEEALQMQQAGEDVIHMEVGEPDFAPPPAVTEALQKAAREGHTHYTHSLGVMALREAVAQWYHRTYGVTVSPQRVIITPGTSGAFPNIFAVLLNAGDKIMFTDPGYPCYPNFARLLGIEPYFVNVEATDGFIPRKDRILKAIDDGVKVAMVASPANPTGAIVPADMLSWLCDLPIPFISDEIYHGLVYSDEPTHTALEFSDEAIVINGLSKRLAMTGLRIGWAIVPEELVRPFQKLNQNLFICPDSISQQAALTALTDPACDAAAQDMARVYARRRKTLLEGLKSLGFAIEHDPRGAFYVFADISRFGDDGFDFALRMLREAKVAATPGVDFGNNKTRKFVRFAYTIDEARIEEGIDRIGKWLGVR